MTDIATGQISWPGRGHLYVDDAASIRPLLHPTEQSRLVLALVAAGLALFIPVFAMVKIGGVGQIILVLAVIIGSIWFATQMRRARLLGRSVRVDSDTFPELQAIVDEVCATLQYHRRLEVYVTEAATPSISTTSMLGTRIILIEGALVADLSQPGKRVQLTFLIGRSVGALRAKHMRLDIVVLVLQWADVLKYVTPFILPYYRATAYSGDQIGMMCCGDLGAALEATRRLLVGGALAGELTAGAVLPQSLLVKRRMFPRLVQLLASEPHVTNRYANLLCFGRYHDPELWAHMRSSMQERELVCLDRIWQRSPYRWRLAAITARTHA
jgi:Zn-dependent protease with chaperone function